MAVVERNNVVLHGRTGAQPMMFAHGHGCDQKHVATRLAGVRGCVPNRALRRRPLKYSDGAVRVAAAEREFSARFTVSDDGPGIPASERERVSRSSSASIGVSSRAAAEPVSASSSRELVHRMGGRIGYLPRPRGTTFIVDVPLAGRR